MVTIPATGAGGILKRGISRGAWHVKNGDLFFVFL
jgi:hypothetical protein